MSYTKEQVARGRKLATNDAMNRLALGDLILEVAPMGKHGGDGGDDSKTTAVVSEFAAEIGITESQAVQYREVSSKVPHAIRDLAVKNKVTVSYGIWRFAVGGKKQDKDRLAVLKADILANVDGHIKVKDFITKFPKNDKGETYKPPHKESQGIESQLADPDARKNLVEKVAADPNVVAEIQEAALSNKLKEQYGEPQFKDEVPTKKPGDGNALSQPILLLELSIAVDGVEKVFEKLSKLDQAIPEKFRPVVVKHLDDLDGYSAGIRAIVTSTVEDVVPQDWN